MNLWAGIWVSVVILPLVSKTLADEIRLHSADLSPELEFKWSLDYEEGRIFAQVMYKPENGISYESSKGTNEFLIP